MGGRWAPTLLWPSTSEQRPCHCGADGILTGFGFHWTCSLARVECHVKTDSCLPAPLGPLGHRAPGKEQDPPSVSSGAGGPMIRAPSHSPSNPFLPFMLWQMYSIFPELLERIWKRWFHREEGDKFILGVPHGFAGYRLQENWPALLFLLSVLSISPCVGFFRAQFWHVGYPSYHWAIFL